jgi:hypothetical protein
MKFIHAKMRFIHMKSFIYGHSHPCRWIKITLNFKFAKLQVQASRSCTSHPPACNNIIFVNDIYLFHKESINGLSFLWAI